jgi:two-component sensor histidine kinase
MVRQFVRDLEWSEDDESDMRLSLLVSELATNAVLHARTSFAVRVTMTAKAIRVSVTDHSFLHPTGRGLHLVDSLSDRWGVLLEPPGKTVWFELDRLQGIA